MADKTPIKSMKVAGKGAARRTAPKPLFPDPLRWMVRRWFDRMGGCGGDVLP